jgi:hypothetical protein
LISHAKHITYLDEVGLVFKTFLLGVVESSGDLVIVVVKTSDVSTGEVGNFTSGTTYSLKIDQ